MCTAAITLAQLEIADENVAKRDRMIRLLYKHLAEIPGITPLAIPSYQDVYSCWMAGFNIDPKQFKISADDFAKQVEEAGIAGAGTGRYYLMPAALRSSPRPPASRRIRSRNRPRRADRLHRRFVPQRAGVPRNLHPLLDLQRSLHRRTLPDRRGHRAKRRGSKSKVDDTRRTNRRLRAFNLGDPIECKLLGGTRNKNFRLRTNTGEFVARDRYVSYRDPVRLGFDHERSPFSQNTRFPSQRHFGRAMVQPIGSRAIGFGNSFASPRESHFREGSVEDFAHLAAHRVVSSSGT